jgi:hypothetical protein
MLEAETIGFETPPEKLTGRRRTRQKIRKAVSDRGRGVRSRGERPPMRGALDHRR